MLERRREEEDNITPMEEEEREVYLNQLTAEERSKNIKLTEKHCRQMMDLIYKKKMEYFKSGGDDWKEVLFAIVLIWRVFWVLFWKTLCKIARARI